jgi:hypothetical protein
MNAPDHAARFQFSASTQWIWGHDDRSTVNIWHYFQKQVSIREHLRRATLLITADSVYELSVNGEFVGRGPVQ